MKGDNREADWVRSAMARYEGPLLRYALRICGSEECARDVVQDTFLRMIEHKGPGDDHLAEWLFTVCRNRAIDLCRKERRMTQLDAPIDTAACPAPPPPALAAAAETAAAVASALDHLPPNQQEVLRLKFQDGFSYKQISSITGHSVSNVGFLIHTGIQTLRRSLRSSSPSAIGEGV